MVAQMARSLALILLGAAVALVLLQRVEPPQRLPLVHASFSLCTPLPGQGDDGDDPDGDAPMVRPEPQHGPHAPDGMSIV